MKYRSIMFCAHANVTPIGGWGKCVCPPDCACREYAGCFLLEGGVKFDHAKQRTDLLDPVAVKGLVSVLTYGAKKYGDRNWEKGMKWSRPYGAILRHLLAFWEGEEIDSESGLPHLDHVGANWMFLDRYYHTHLGSDDRPSMSVPTVGESSQRLEKGTQPNEQSSPVVSVRVPGVGV